MKVNELIALFERMYAQHWAYEWGAAREGVVDCSGAFVYAFKKYGQSIYHGSNTIARQYISGNLHPASDAKPGWAVFKRRFDGQEPAQYKSDGLGNIYHIGLLASDGVSVLNAKGQATGFSSDPLSKWQYAAPLKGVEYEEGGVLTDYTLCKAKVVLNSGYLKVRSAAGTSAPVVSKLYNGDAVDVYEQIELTTNPPQKWSRIGSNQWVSSDYLVRVEDEKSDSVGAKDDSGTVAIPRSLAKQLYKELGDALNVD